MAIWMQSCIDVKVRNYSISSYTKLKEQELQDTHSYHHQKQNEDHYWIGPLVEFRKWLPTSTWCWEEWRRRRRRDGGLEKEESMPVWEASVLEEVREEQ